jgi:TonB family protein
MKTMRGIGKLLLAGITLPLLSYPASALGPARMRSTRTLYLQESGAGAPLGKLNVPADVMAGHCITMVSPNYPETAGDSRTASTVVVRVVIFKSGEVSPMRAISGPASLEDAAMDAARLWRYKPFLHDGEPIDITTEISVNFTPGKPGGVITHPSH